MNLNKWLCKYFDISGKGYVTIGNIVTILSTGLIILSLSTAILYSIYRFFLSGGFSNNAAMREGASIWTWEAWGGAIVMFIGLGIAIIIIMVLHIIITSIWGYKIAKCPSKDEEKHD